VRFLFSAVLAGLIAGCSASSVPPIQSGATSFAPDTVALAKGCSATNLKMNPNGGIFTLPKCDGFSGKLPYPKFQGVGGTLTANIVMGPSESDVGHISGKPKGKITLYIGITFKSSDKSDSESQFYDSTISPTDGGKIFGPFVKSKKYWGDIVLTQSGAAHCSFSFGATVKKGEILAIALPGTSTQIGVRQFIVVDSDNCGGS
jgi:hypothetical protein